MFHVKHFNIKKYITTMFHVKHYFKKLRKKYVYFDCKIEYTNYIKDRGEMYMGKHRTLKKIVAATIVVGTAMYVANEYIIKIATSKNLLKKSEGNLYPFKYGNVFYKVSGEGKPVLLIHDINECSSGMEWFYLEKKLSKTNKVYTIEQNMIKTEQGDYYFYNHLSKYIEICNDDVIVRYKELNKPKERTFYERIRSYNITHPVWANGELKEEEHE